MYIYVSRGSESSVSGLENRGQSDQSGQSGGGLGDPAQQASMRTCSEPAQVWVVGECPSNQDRRLLETLHLLPREKLTAYPSISQYLTQLALYSRTEQLSWRDPYNKPSVKNPVSGLARRLDLNQTF